MGRGTAYDGEVSTEQLTELAGLEPRPLVMAVAHVHAPALDETILAVGGHGVGALGCQGKHTGEGSLSLKFDHNICLSAWQS